MPVDDPSTGEIVGGQGYDDLVARHDPDSEFSHFPGGVGHHDHSVIELDSEVRVSKLLEDSAVDLDRIVILFAFPYGSGGGGVLLGLGSLSLGAGPLLLFLDHVLSLEPGILSPANTAGGETPGRFRRTSLVDVKNRESGAIIQIACCGKKSVFSTGEQSLWAGDCAIM